MSRLSIYVIAGISTLVGAMPSFAFDEPSFPFDTLTAALGTLAPIVSVMLLLAGGAIVVVRGSFMHAVPMVGAIIMVNAAPAFIEIMEPGLASPTSIMDTRRTTRAPTRSALKVDTPASAGFATGDAW